MKPSHHVQRGECQSPEGRLVKKGGKWDQWRLETRARGLSTRTVNTRGNWLGAPAGKASGRVREQVEGPLQCGAKPFKETLMERKGNSPPLLWAVRQDVPSRKHFEVGQCHLALRQDFVTLFLPPAAVFATQVYLVWNVVRSNDYRLYSR